MSGSGPSSRTEPALYSQNLQCPVWLVLTQHQGVGMCKCPVRKAARVSGLIPILR